jgi:hypothetical protein
VAWKNPCRFYISKFIRTPKKALNKTSFYGLGVKTIEILGVFGYGLKLPPKTAHSPFISAYKSQKYMQKVDWSNPVGFFHI